VIGLTGNIATGKSVVRQMLQHLGAYTIDADGLAHQAMSPGAPAYKPVVESFGQIILNPDKSINRNMLGNLVFGNPDLMKKLEGITHPVISGAINTLVGRAKQSVVVIEAIKLLEGDLAGAVDAVWVVDAKPQTQYRRLVGKRRISEDEAKKRMLSQAPQADKVKKATVVIDNDGDVEKTWTQVQSAWKKIAQPSAPAAPTPPAAQPAKPAAPAPSQPAAATPAPQPAAPAAQADDGAIDAPISDIDTSGITIKRGMPNSAEDLAGFINKHSGKSLSRMDMMLEFGQKSYLSAHNSSDKVVAVMGFQVENLITRVDELYIEADAPHVATIAALVLAIEEASTQLQSEVAFYFLASDSGNDVLQPFLKSGYEVTTVKEIKIPAWREAVQEIFTDGMVILTRKLRKDRVLKPI
jgi:dephospho-CoA kinase